MTKQPIMNQPNKKYANLDPRYNPNTDDPISTSFWVIKVFDRHLYYRGDGELGTFVQAKHYSSLERAQAALLGMLHHSPLGLKHIDEFRIFRVQTDFIRERARA